MRDDQPRGFNLGGERSMAINLIIVTGVIYVVDMLFGSSNPQLRQGLYLHSDLFQSSWGVWQLLTYGFMHSPSSEPNGIFHVLMNMYGLFLFGRPVEAKYGRIEFLRLYLTMIVFSGAVWLGVQSIFGGVGSVVGASGAVVGIAIIFCLSFPQRRLYLMGLIEIPAWALGIAFITIDLFNAIGIGGENIAWQAHLAGAAFGFLYFWFKWNLGAIFPSRWASSLARLKRKPRLKIHDPEARNKNKDSQADRLLDKVHREGEESLTAKERKILEDYSRRMRQKHQ